MWFRSSSVTHGWYKCVVQIIVSNPRLITFRSSPLITHLSIHMKTIALYLLHNLSVFRDRPFNLKGGLWFFVSFRNFFSDNTRVRIFIFLSCKTRIFFPEFNVRLYDKNSESDYFFPPPKSEYFFQQHRESEYFFRKKP